MAYAATLETDCPTSFKIIRQKQAYEEDLVASLWHPHLRVEPSIYT